MGKILKSERDGSLYEKREPTTTCNAFTKGHYCRRPAGWGNTSHPGTGRCKWHGGASTGRPTKKFSLKNFVNNDILRKLEEANKIDPNVIKDVTNEIIVLRANLYGYLIRCRKANQLWNPGVLQTYIYSLVKLVTIKHKMDMTKEDAEPYRLAALYVAVLMKILKGILPNELFRQIRIEVKRIRLDEIVKQVKKETKGKKEIN